MNKLLCVMLSGLILVGCATQRPSLPEDQYFAFAKAWHSVGWCAYKGWMDSETAARGKTYISANLNRYSYDQSRLAQEDKSQSIAQALDGMTEGDCRNIAVNVQARKQQIQNQNVQADMQNQEAQSMLRATKPTQTYCNKIGTQLLCNSY